MEKKKLGPLDYFAALMIFGIVTIVTCQVIWRYIFNNSLSWSEELSRYLFAWLIFVGAAVAVKENAHINVDIIFNYLSPAKKRYLNLFLYALIIFVQGYFLYFAVQFIVKTHGTYSTAMGVPMNIVVYPSIAVGCVVTIYFCVRGIAKLLGSSRREAAKE